MSQEIPAQPFIFLELPKDMQLKILEILGINPQTINPMRTVSKDFNAALNKLFDGYLDRLFFTIKTSSTNAENSLNEGKLDHLKEIEIFDLMQSFDIVKKLGGTSEEKIKKIIDLYLTHIRQSIICITEINNETIKCDDDELQKKEVLYLMAQKAHASGYFHLLWEKEKDSKFNRYLKAIIQEHINDAAIGNGILKINDFRNADLAGIKFGNGNLNQVVDIENARFENANLENVDLSGATNISPNALSQANCLIGLKGIRQENNHFYTGGNVKVVANPFQGSVPRHLAKEMLQKKIAQHYKDRFSKSDDFMEILSILSNLIYFHPKNFLKIPVVDANFLKFTPTYYRDIVEIGREKLVALANAGKINISDDIEHMFDPYPLKKVFKETFGSDTVNFWSKPKNQQQLEIILEKTDHINEIKINRLNKQNQDIAEGMKCLHL